ncbi:SMI1/KNR4 family protein [Kineosporia sp. J2-2]|uniref:SMI1/KNR4 family protein n=1 Tax=Kineosporia corallincola TaxID=2835133 RepID=A0ABS5TPY9_9ACTN|nr:SMI1/KNR4 family protein [Kineosporia corallincola]MBT0773142.1 SMI1/KNR4 family protein [Kineosporia corallincola]
MCPTSITQWQDFLARFDPAGSRNPATEAEIRAAEERLGTALPPGLRDFLAASNGWDHVAVCSTTELRWTDDPAHDLVDAWSSFEEVIELIGRCLVVIDTGEGHLGLVDATRTSGDGEWVAYAWAAGDGIDPRPFPDFTALLTELAEEELTTR